MAPQQDVPCRHRLRHLSDDQVFCNQLNRR
jgi:hypothetical protein